MDSNIQDASEQINDSSKVIELASYARTMDEVNSQSASEYQSIIKSMEQASKVNTHSLLPALFIDVTCVQALSEAGVAINQLITVGIPVCELVAAGFTPSDLLSAGIYPEDLLAAGINPADLGMKKAS